MAQNKKLVHQEALGAFKTTKFRRTRRKSRLLTIAGRLVTKQIVSTQQSQVAKEESRFLNCDEKRNVNFSHVLSLQPAQMPDPKKFRERQAGSLTTNVIQVCSSASAAQLSQHDDGLGQDHAWQKKTTRPQSERLAQAPGFHLCGYPERLESQSQIATLPIFFRAVCPQMVISTLALSSRISRGSSCKINWQRTQHPTPNMKFSNSFNFD